MMASSAQSRRILDFLNDGEEVGSTGERPSTVATPRSPSAPARSMLLSFRWAKISRLGRKGPAGVRRKGKGHEHQQHEEKEVIVVENGDGGEGTRLTNSSVGLSLLFLLAKTSDELRRMAMVRTEMETLLKEFKQQVGGTASDDGAVRAARNVVESTASSCLTADGNEQRVANDARTSPELHAELQRLQVNYGCSPDTPPLSLPEEHGAAAEPPEDISDYYHQRGGFSDDDDSDSVEEEEDVAGDEYADADDDDDGAEFNGVSAVELERRLHELLHQRNQERIEELEAALRRAERKLVARETQACLRQDDDDNEDPLQ